MRLLAAFVLIVLVAIVLATNVFRPAPAKERLAGVTVAVAGYTIEPQPRLGSFFPLYSFPSYTFPAP